MNEGAYTPGPETVDWSRKISIREAAETYAKGRMGVKEGHEPDPKQQKNIDTVVNRANEVVLEGSAEMNTRMDRLFQPGQEKMAAALKADTREFATTLATEQLELFKGQEHKLGRMQEYVGQMAQWADAYYSEQLAERHLAPDSPAAQALQKAIREATVDATRAISYQDQAASAVTIGDHGWSHLTQDLRDAVAIAEGKAKRPLTNKEKFMLGLTAAYHDIGYATPQVADKQQESPANYGAYDRGHPLLSFVYLEANRHKLEAALGPEAAYGVRMMTLNHENPERAAQAGQFTHLSEAFALADANAAFGADKLPPVIVNVPETLAYLGVDQFLTAAQASDPERLDPEIQDRIIGLQELKDQKRAQVEAIIREKYPQQAEAYLNALNHFSSESMGFLLGRMAGESTKPEVDEAGVMNITVKAGLASELEDQHNVEGGRFHSVRLSIKLFSELSVTDMPDHIKQALIKAVSEASGGRLEQQLMALQPQLPENVSVKYDRNTDTTTFLNKNTGIAVRYEHSQYAQPDQNAKGPGFTDSMRQVLGSLNEEVKAVYQNTQAQAARA